MNTNSFNFILLFWYRKVLILWNFFNSIRFMTHNSKKELWKCSLGNVYYIYGNGRKGNWIENSNMERWEAILRLYLYFGKNINTKNSLKKTPSTSVPVLDVFGLSLSLIQFKWHLKALFCIEAAIVSTITWRGSVD